MRVKYTAMYQHSAQVRQRTPATTTKMIVYRFQDDVSKETEEELEEEPGPPAGARLLEGARITGGVTCGVVLVVLYGKQYCAVLPPCCEAQMSFKIGTKKSLVFASLMYVTNLIYMLCAAVASNTSVAFAGVTTLYSIR